MPPQSILVVEHNLITLQATQAILERAGYTVLAAQDGQSALAIMAHECPDLVLQDVGLPDGEGVALAAQLRALPGGAGRPILAFSDILSEPEQTCLAEAGFTDYVAKPLEPSRLLDTVRAYLPPPAGDAEKAGSGQRILVVNDDPLQRKLLTLQLEQAGFGVSTAQDGLEALAQVRTLPPDAVVSDVLMPRLDGFKLCQAIRQDPGLARIPVVLISAAYTEEEDQQLARTVGADVLIPHTPDLHNVIVTLLPGASAAPRRQVPVTDDVAAEYTERVVHQLERQARLNVDLATHVARMEAQSALLARLAETLKDPAAGEVALDELLHSCLGASGLARGAIYLLDPAGHLYLRSQCGYSARDAALLPEFFGQAELLHRAMWEDELVELCTTGRGVAQTSADQILEQSGDTAMLILPLILGEERLGVLVVASAHRDLGERWGAFIRALGSQLSQAIGLARSLTRLRASEEAERQARERAERAVRVRDQFLSVAAHELKTPLTSLLGFTQVLLRLLDKQNTLDPAQGRALRTIEQQAEKLNLLVCQLLDVSRIEAGRLALERKPTEITHLIAGVVTAARARTSAHTLVVEAPPSMQACVDPLRLEQVLTNLVDNAIKYSPAGGLITIALSTPAPNMVRLAVRDQGLGIPVEQRAHIFDRFYQAHASSHRSGLGLGLFISRQIVELHGGRLEAAFPPEGGSVFVVSLPTGPASVSNGSVIGSVPTRGDVRW